MYTYIYIYKPQNGKAEAITVLASARRRSNKGFCQDSTRGALRATARLIRCMLPKGS